MIIGLYSAYQVLRIKRLKMYSLESWKKEFLDFSFQLTTFTLIVKQVISLATTDNRLDRLIIV
jgi:hypothetical protein